MEVIDSRRICSCRSAEIMAPEELCCRWRYHPPCEGTARMVRKYIYVF